MAKKQKLEIGSSNLISVKPITDNQKIVFDTWKKKQNQFLFGLSLIHI